MQAIHSFTYIVMRQDFPVLPGSAAAVERHFRSAQTRGRDLWCRRQEPRSLHPATSPVRPGPHSEGEIAGSLPPLPNGRERQSPMKSNDHLYNDLALQLVL